jgi:glycosyltransferase involved in cell wall biosynthesis
MSGSLVSVIIPVFNAEKYLVASLESILRQSYRELEILICDDASTDQSLRVLQSFNDPRIKMVRNEVNRGYLRTINLLLEMSTGDYIAFHDADDVSHMNRIASQIEFLNTHPDVALVGTNFNMIDEKGKVVHEHKNQMTDPSQIKSVLMNRNIFQKPSILFRRQVFEKIGGFREGFLKLKNISEDYDWLLRASEHFAMSNVNGKEPLYDYRSVPTAMTKGFQDVEQTFGHRIAQFLANERRATGTDSMMREDWTTLFQMIEQWKTPYQNDPSLFSHEKAESLLYAGLYNEAIRWALRACRIQPVKYRNVKTLASALKNSLMH